MALDRYDDGLDGRHDGQPEQRHRRHGGSAGDAPAARPEPAAPAESRTRAEYYQALRAADNQPVPARDHDPDHAVPADARQDRSGWDDIDPAKRPPLDALRVTPERSVHILDGEAGGKGGHRHGTGHPGKTEFPASWDDQKILGHILDVARRPDSPPEHQHWNDRWLSAGTRDGVEVSVVVQRNGEVCSAWPEEGGPEVVRNPRKES